MESEKRHNTTDTTNFCPRQLVTDLLRTCRLCCGLLWGSRQLVTDLLRGNWCNGFWPIWDGTTIGLLHRFLWLFVALFFHQWWRHVNCEHVIVRLSVSQLNTKIPTLPHILDQELISYRYSSCSFCCCVIEWSLVRLPARALAIKSSRSTEPSIPLG